MLYNPNVILKTLSTQSAYINRVYGQMFYFIDKAELWADTQSGSRVLVSDIYILQYERERNNFVPNNRSTLATELDMLTNEQYLTDYIYIYVVESNCLYTYSYNTRTWNRIYGLYGQTTVAQTYLPDGNAVIVSADDVTTNGILNDGSVVIRDGNKMICGQLQSDGYTMYIKSLIGGQINLEPSGSKAGNGCLQLNSQSTANLNSDLVVFGSISTVSSENWNKQYRLITQDILIKSYTLIKAGSTLVKGSIINGTTYSTNTQITSDIETEDEGQIIIGSKIYKDSIINEADLTPPYLIDTDSIILSSCANNLDVDATTINTDNIIINMNSPLKNSGDCCYILTDGKSLSKITKVIFNDTEYNVTYIAGEGLESTAYIKYYAINNTVKILA